MAKRNWIDISVPVEDGMVHWPGDPPVAITRQNDISAGDCMNVSALSLGAHTGTHMDAPRHFFQSGKSLHELPMDAVIGPARIIRIRDKESVKVDELKAHRIRKGERILFKTENSLRAWNARRFTKNFVYISPDAAEFLGARRVCTIGIDYLSIGGFYADGTKIHKSILAAGIWVIEGLNLANVSEGRYDLVCLPIKAVDIDGAPARAVVRQRS
jgi:arylformamidase